MTRFAAPIAEQIWDMKYRFKDADGAPLDGTVEDSWRRIARSLASVEQDAAYWEDQFYSALEDFKYLPAGRITAGAGTQRSVTLFNCFVMGTVPDSMGGIFDMLKEAALTMQQGGGIGYDFSTIRPKGAPVSGVAADASGPLSFMDVWDSMCRTIMSAGSRRGAMMATMRCDHPDIEDFIAAKADSARLRMFNLSVLITDPFMEAVKADGPWELTFGDRVYKTVQARDLWNRIMRATYDYAEPGVIFIDRINAANNLSYCETIAATNPCGEQPLPPYGACLLGSVNLARLVWHPFEDEKAHVCKTQLSELVRTAVRMMDNVVDASRFPLEAQAQEAQAKRRIGLGVTGLADALLMCGLRYGSDEAAAKTEEWLHLIAREAYLASVELAKEKGAFPLFDADKYLASGTMRGMDDDVREAIRTHGIRNALLTSIAPTGTISLYAGNVSSGIEPVFAYSYTRKVLQKDGTRTEEEVVDYAVQMWRDKFGDAELPDYFVNAQTLAPLDHVKMQAAAQKWVDSSISKTINCPEDISFEDFKDVYIKAYEDGCKGCTTYRPNDVTGSVLSVSEGTEKTPAETPALAREASGGDVIYMSEPLDRPQELEGATYKLKWPDSEHAIYLTINDIVVGGHRRPFEVFINSKNMEHFAWTVALTRMISAVFRRGGDVSFVVEELKAVFDPRGGAWVQGKYIPSILAAIGGVIEKHMVSTGFLEGEGMGLKSDPQAAVVNLDQPRGKACPSCGQFDMRMVEGCMTCGSCGHSKCG
ncbi:adenosylcobalamin-dependent ribonucleoside-diphosphate reductase [Thalassococcus lentus]|uniref:Vitamin B12-dependent ribonucleotide reductase n=1 Tax=Thalassococcus lentus TaxID=1210524 RepID=A0ABT4XPX5_9RHOB|nr:adenosylcobalamin-dependent ribonucleoside-diphosphate reductase [Thalassococcus lentus]MDA7424011.1 adenosylcobalamin-dependent ribonucleoside-diphosphate reductase [Thalassococcus lentus]